MENIIISMKDITKDYGNGKGIFNINMDVHEGEVYGFLGPNGAGKSTTIRNLMGFITPDSGSMSICGMDCFKQADKIHKNLGYLAGEIAFLEDYTGRQMIDFMAKMRGMTSRKKINDLMERFELDASGKIKKMSKGMKQKVGIICAFMDDPQVLILDEPTSGLDPLMQNRFIELILEEKKNGKTILMSSHIFEEVERTCDRTAIINAGRIASVEDMELMSSRKTKTYEITFSDSENVDKFIKDNEKLNPVVNERKVSVVVSGNADEMVKILAKYNISDLDIRSQTLEELFMHFYQKG